ncbi:nucleotidyltransferase domain-containing protein, partial [Streptomyces lunaelactis]
MKRARAAWLLEQMLHRLDRDSSWPLGLVQQVWLFGSFARGAAEPHDVDVAVRFERDEQMTQAVVQSLLSGRANPYAPLRRALAGSSRGLQFQFEDQAREQLETEGVAMLPLWKRDDMIDAFAGLDRYIPRPVRADLIGWQQQGLIAISQVPLSDAPEDTDLLAEPQMQWAVGERWKDDSPLRRAALAGLVHLHGLGADFDDVDLAGQRLPTPRRMAGHRSEARWSINTGSGAVTSASRTASPAGAPGSKWSSPPAP